MGTFDEVTTFASVGQGRFEGTVDEAWGQGRTAYGGFGAAVALRAMRSHLAPERRLRSALVQFVGPLAPEAAQVHTRVLREGRSMTHVEAHVLQDGTPRLVVVAAFGADRPSALAIPAEPMPEVAADAGLVMPYLPGVTPTFTQHFTYRWTNGAMPFGGAAEPWLRGWIAHRNAERFDEAALVGLLDAPPPPMWVMLTRPAPASSVTWQVNVVGAFDDDTYAPDAPFLFDARTTAAADGWSDMSGTLWDAQGRCVARTRQLVADFTAR